MKYNRDSTINHELVQKYPNCLQDFDEIIFNDDDSLDSKPNDFNNVKVINLDDVEISVSREQNNRQRNKTMDTTFVISNENKEEMLLVELRFNYTNLKNLKLSELKGKIEGSCLLLNDLIHEKYIFIFKTNVTPVARNRLSRMNPKPPQNYEVMDLDKLKETYF